VLIGLLLAAVIGLTVFNFRFVVQNPGGNDFLARWMGARLWLKEGISPYDEQVSLSTQEMIYGHPADPSQGEDLNHFVYPLYSMVFFAPFGLLEFTPARAVWMTVLEISLVLLVFVSLHLTGWRTSPVKTITLVLFAILWYHGIRTLILGQFAGINALLIALALLFIQQKQDDFACPVHQQAADGCLAGAICLALGIFDETTWDHLRHVDHNGCSDGRFICAHPQLAPCNDTTDF
jgi:hypothetical protein